MHCCCHCYYYYYRYFLLLSLLLFLLLLWLLFVLVLLVSLLLLLLLLLLLVTVNVNSYYYYDCFYSTKCVCTCVWSVFVRAPAISTYITLTLAMLVMTCSTRLSRGAMLGCFQASRSHTCVVRETQGRFYLLQSWVTPLFIAFIILRGLIKLRDKTLARLHQWRCDQSFVFFCGIFWAILGHCNIHQHTTTVDRHTLRLNGDVCGHSQPVPRRREGQRINCGDPR